LPNRSVINLQSRDNDVVKHVMNMAIKKPLVKNLPAQTGYLVQPKPYYPIKLKLKDCIKRR
jgi:murein endopeptidase